MHGSFPFVKRLGTISISRRISIASFARVTTSSCLRRLYSPSIKRSTEAHSISNTMSSQRVPIQPAKLLSKHSYTVPGKLAISELTFEVPLDHSKPNDNKALRLFARTCTRHETPAAPPSADSSKAASQKPYFVHIPGGPGFGCPFPSAYPDTNFLLDKGYQLLYLDNRGMGLSSPLTAETIAKTVGNDPARQAEYLKFFRADHAVRDYEAVRLAVTDGWPEENGARKWSVQGQSYGGFVATTYLSFYPEGLREVFTTGGLPPVTQCGPDEVYRRLFKKVVERNKVYYAKYPQDEDKVRGIFDYLWNLDNKIALPNGGALSIGRVETFGLEFGFHGGLETVHQIVTRMANDLEIFGFFTRPTLAKCEGMGGSFDNNIIYGILHEPIYAQGNVAPNWSAQRLLREYLEYYGGTTTSFIENQKPIFFTGEQVFMNDFVHYTELAKLRPAAELLMGSTEWSQLYDIEQLKRNEVPVYSASYIDDMYVDIGFAIETAGIIKGLKHFVTNAMYHDATRSKSEDLMKYLWALRDDSID